MEYYEQNKEAYLARAKKYRNTEKGQIQYERQLNKTSTLNRFKSLLKLMDKLVSEASDEAFHKLETSQIAKDNKVLFGLVKTKRKYE